MPDGVRSWIDVLAEAEADGLSFDEALEWFDGGRATPSPRGTLRVAAPVMGYSPLLSKG